MQFSFEITHRDPTSAARLGVLHTPRGSYETPLFMPVGTAATVKSLTTTQVEETGARILLVNAYHMHLQPGEDIVAQQGGLHQFMNWPHTIITDSGGYQVFSLPNRTITEEGVRFQMEKKGKPVTLSPEDSMQIQQKLGADIAMAFDECVAYPAAYDYAREAMERTLRWAKRCQAAHTRPDQLLFGIVQGSTYADLRKACAEEISAMDFPGIAIGGLSVGEGLDIMSEVLDYTVPHLPDAKPRYLMGVGLPEDILAYVEAGVDISDCVIPTKYARSGQLFTRVGRIRITRRDYRRDKFPVDTNCGCHTCTHYSRAYLHHLFQAGEILGHSLASIHNIQFYQELMRDIRAAIAEGRFGAFKRDFLATYTREDRKNRHVR